MKITFEFDNTIDNFDYCEFERYKQVDSMAICLGQIADKVRYWLNKDNRVNLSTEEIADTIFGIIEENNINLERLGY